MSTSSSSYGYINGSNPVISLDILSGGCYNIRLKMVAYVDSDGSTGYIQLYFDDTNLHVVGISEIMINTKDTKTYHEIDIIIKATADITSLNISGKWKIGTAHSLSGTKLALWAMRVV